MQIHADTKSVELQSGKNVDFGLNEGTCLVTTVDATNSCLESLISVQHLVKFSILLHMCWHWCECLLPRYCLLLQIFQILYYSVGIWFSVGYLQLVRSLSVQFHHHRNVRFGWVGSFHFHTKVRGGKTSVETSLLFTQCNSFLHVYLYDRSHVLSYWLFSSFV